MLQISVTGLFKEINNKKEEFIRYFDRTLIIVPEGLGYCIINEQVHISEPTEAQKKFMLSKEEQIQKLVQRLSDETKMNIAWSSECLKVANWDYQKACASFQEAFKLGKIPQEAFTR